MRKIDQKGFELLLATTRIIEKDKFGPKVVITKDGSYLKIFRRKRWFSSTAIYPYARRFCHNAKRLQLLGVKTVRILELYSCPSLGRHLVSYQPLAGETLLKIFSNPQDQNHLLADLAAYIARLHHLGILFRSLHFGNLLLLPEGDFGLIDIADLTISNRPLTLSQRMRNFKHLLYRPVEKKIITHFGEGVFLKCYLQHSELTAMEQKKLTAKYLAFWTSKNGKPKTKE